MAVEGAREGASRKRPGSSTAPLRVSELSTKVEDRRFLVDNRVDYAPCSAYCPTSALLLRPVNG
jgi:hypothetical protein